MQVIMMARLYAMYQQSRKMLLFLVVALLISLTNAGVAATIESRRFEGGKL